MATELLDLDKDVLVMCASKLGVRDISSMAISCRALRDVAYADPPWERQWRIRWPPKATNSGMFQFCGGRDAYLYRHVASQQFKFKDPFERKFVHSSNVINQLLLDCDRVVAAQGPNVLLATEDGFVNCLREHNARITCMRLFSGIEYLRMNKLLVTASADHTIRLWTNDSVFRTLRGHCGTVSAIADKLLPLGILASGGMDLSIRLWSVAGSHRKRSPLQATLHGHESYVKELAVAGHNPSILVSAAKDSKLRVWDVGSKAACVGMCRGPGSPVSLKCVDSVCYFTGGSTVVPIDLRTMQTSSPVAYHDGTIHGTAVAPSGWLLCTGGEDRCGKLWDVRKCGQRLEPVSIYRMQEGPVDFVHVDSFKVITAGRDESIVRVWDSRDGGELVNSLDHEGCVTALTAKGTRLAVGTRDASRVATASYRDYGNCVEPIQVEHSPGMSKFWDL